MKRKGLEKKNHKLTNEDLRPNYEALANAIVLQACIDYQKEKGDTMKARVRRDSIVSFFHSPLYGLITDIDPDDLIKRLEKGKQIEFPDDVSEVGGALA